MAKRAKHTHKYIHQKLSKFNMGWRCALEYCDHFLPKNVEDTINGRMSVCWDCGEEFRLDEHAIKEDMPKCIDCRLGSKAEDDVDFDGFEQIQAAKYKHGVESLGDLKPHVIVSMQMLGTLPQHIPGKYLIPSEPDEIEIIESEHASDCATFLGLDCDCRSGD